MAQLPTAQDLGIVLPQADRPTVSYKGGIAEGAEAAVGESISRLGQEVTAGAEKIQDVHDKVVTDDAVVKFQNAAYNRMYGNPNDPNDHGYLGLQGQAALEGRKPVLDALESDRVALLNSLGSDRQRLAFSEASRRLYQTELQRAGAHSLQQANVFAAKTSAAAQDIALRSIGADPFNEDGFQLNSEAAVRGARNEAISAGLGPQAADDAGLKALNQAATQRAVAMGADNPSAALAFVKSNRSAFDGLSYARLVEHLQPKADHLEGSAIAGAAWNGGIGSAGASGNIADAIHQQESRGRTTSATSVDGAMGGWQITPGTFAQYARPGEVITNPEDNERVGRRIIADYSQTFGNDPARVAVAYFSGPGNVAPAGSPTPWKRDAMDGNKKSTSSYVSDVLGRLAKAGPASSEPSTTGPVYPDVPALARDIVQRTDGRPEVQRAALSDLQHRASLYALETADKRRQIERGANDTIAALEDGKDDVAIPEADIRASLEPAHANELIERMNVAKDAGQIFKGVALGTPEDIIAARADLASGLGVRSSLIRAKHQAPGGASDQETPEQYGMRMKILGQFDKMVQVRQAALDADPSGYVAVKDPRVGALWQAAQKGDPVATSAYADAVQSGQEQLGVPEGRRSVLPRTAAAAFVEKLTTTPPDKLDVRAQLGALKDKWGDAYPRAFGDLVKAGLPPGYQVLATMDRPEQAGDAARLQGALALAKQKGGVHMVAEATGQPLEVKAINDDVGNKMADFRKTLPANASGMALYDHVESAVKLLAYTNLMDGQAGSGSTALSLAVDGVINKKYDLHGTWRSEKQYSGPAVEAADWMERDLSPESLAPIGGNPQLTEAERKSALMSGIRSSGAWLNNSDESGITLTYLAQGVRMPVLRTDGRPVEIRFNAIPARPSAAQFVPADPMAGIP